MSVHVNCEVCGRPAWRVWDGVWLCKRGFMLKAYGTTVTCRAILDDPKDDLAAQRSLSDLEQARRDAR